MKKLLLSLFILFGINVYSYNYPFKNPYVATVLGTSMMMTPDIDEKIPIEEYRISFIETRETPANLDYQKDYKFSVALQDKKAPLVFILSGTGSSSTSLKTELFQRIFYTAGYHVVGVSSTMNTNSVVSLSYEKMPGIILNDGMDIYRAINKIKKIVEKKAKVSDYYLMGYSLGATHSAMVSYIDEIEKDFNFKRVFMVNPAVNLYTSASILDNMLEKSIDNDIRNLFVRINTITDNLTLLTGKNEDLRKENPEKVLRTLGITDKDLQMGIGLVFRLSAIDINFLSDATNKRGVYVDKEIEKYENMGAYFEKINFASFEDYVKRLAVPYYREQYGTKMSLEELKKYTDLKVIEDYLRNTDKIMAVTNRDELILTKENIKYLQDVFKGRIIVYPYGGHCGNMYYYENVKNMLNFMRGGKLVEVKK
ncbi:serine/threonine protein kinase [Fusobacterium sp.]|uniref:serine/threonine protein kinase n=1 Tax=Fusobacterium sp. TaxID=68766 RepID=UPI00262BF37F|nr:serine/threonine protein kinase [Fusobacterium sp.]